jgi:hypothetical protein
VCGVHEIPAATVATGTTISAFAVADASVGNGGTYVCSTGSEFWTVYQTPIHAGTVARNAHMSSQAACEGEGGGKCCEAESVCDRKKRRSFVTIFS